MLRLEMRVDLRRKNTSTVGVNHLQLFGSNESSCELERHSLGDFKRNSRKINLKKNSESTFTIQ